MTERMAFGGLTIAYDDRVLRPREWTTAQSDWAAELMVTAPGGPVLELCSGAGHIGLLAVAASGRRLPRTSPTAPTSTPTSTGSTRPTPGSSPGHASSST